MKKSGTLSEDTVTIAEGDNVIYQGVLLRRKERNDIWNI